MSKIMNATKVITGPNTRWSYANVWDAKSINGGAPKYSVSLIIPKSDTATVEKIKAAIQAAYEEGQSKLKGNGKTVLGRKAGRTKCGKRLLNIQERGINNGKSYSYPRYEGFSYRRS